MNLFSSQLKNSASYLVLRSVHIHYNQFSGQLSVVTEGLKAMVEALFISHFTIDQMYLFCTIIHEII